MSRVLAVPFVVALMICYPLRAQAQVPPPGIDCKDPDVAQIDYNCPALWEHEADAKMNAVYKDLLAALTSQPETVAKLRESQRAWLKFRDADAALVVEHYGERGSLGASIWSMRRFQLTRQRLKDLQSRLADMEGW